MKVNLIIVFNSSSNNFANNFTGLANRFEEYPKLRELIRLKDDLIERTNTPPM